MFQYRESYKVATNSRRVFSPKLVYIEGSKNIVSFILSRLDKIDNQNSSNNNNKVEPIL